MISFCSCVLSLSQTKVMVTSKRENTQREFEVCVCVPFSRTILERKSVFKCKCDRVLRVLYCEEVLGQKERKIRARNTRRMKMSFHVSL